MTTTDRPPTKRRRWRWGRLLFAALVLAAVAAVVDAVVVEPQWVKVRRVRLTPAPSCRIVQFSDLHYRGDRAALERVVARINALDADVVCFTGDLVEDDAFLPEVLAILGTVNKPLYGIPGNHDIWSARDDAAAVEAFARTGGRWLADGSVLTGKGVTLVGGVRAGQQAAPAAPGERWVLLLHDPRQVKSLGDQHFNLILAGHTHGGQLRIPFVWRRLLPDIAEYDRGLFQTPAGPLYVNPGLGTFMIQARFACRPEITVLEF